MGFIMKTIFIYLMFALIAFVASRVYAQTREGLTENAHKNLWGRVVITDLEQKSIDGFDLTGLDLDSKKCDHFKASEPFNILIVFAGCKAGQDGKCNLIADMEVIRPDGTVRDVDQNFVVSDTYPVVDGSISTGNSYFGMIMGTEELAGEYTVRVNLKDRNRKVPLPLSSCFIVEGQSAR